MTTAHVHTDIRIFQKECRTLSKAGYELHFVAPGAPEESIDGVLLHGVEKPVKGRLGRMTRTAADVARVARSVDADIYHFHDSELIPAAVSIAKSGRKVIYDVHEDLPADIADKDWIPSAIRKPTALAAQAMESWCADYMTAIVGATPAIAAKFPPDKSVAIQNFPHAGELFAADSVPHAGRHLQFAYVGVMIEIRGVREMTEAIGLLTDHPDVRLALAGTFYPIDLESAIMRLPGADKLNCLGQQSRSEVRALLGSSRAGLVTFYPVRNHVEAQPNKLFEYMSAGLPVIASDFPLWRQIIEGAKCGLLVDPCDPVAIAGAMRYLLEHPDEGEAMGNRGRLAVEEKYNWEREGIKLVQLYDRILNQ